MNEYTRNAGLAYPGSRCEVLAIPATEVTKSMQGSLNLIPTQILRPIVSYPLSETGTAAEELHHPTSTSRHVERGISVVFLHT